MIISVVIKRKCIFVPKHGMLYFFQVLYSYSIGFVYILIGQVVTAQLWEAFAFCLKVSCR